MRRREAPYRVVGNTRSQANGGVPAMFIQVIQGQIGDLAALRRQWDRWQGELAAGAEGWLGTTAGVTGQDRFIAVVRFESEQAARRNSDRPEQGQWWAKTAKSLSGEVSFRDSVQADAFLGGGSDGAGFVQVVQGQATDAERLRRARVEQPGYGALRSAYLAATASKSKVGWKGRESSRQQASKVNSRLRWRRQNRSVARLPGRTSRPSTSPATTVAPAAPSAAAALCRRAPVTRVSSTSRTRRPSTGSVTVKPLGSAWPSRSGAGPGRSSSASRSRLGRSKRASRWTAVRSGCWPLRPTVEGIVATRSQPPRALAEMQP